MKLWLSEKQLSLYLGQRGGWPSGRKCLWSQPSNSKNSEGIDHMCHRGSSKNPEVSYQMAPSQIPTSPPNLPSCGSKSSPFQIVAKRLKINENVNSAYLRTHWLYLLIWVNNTESSRKCAVIEWHDHHCGDDLVFVVCCCSPVQILNFCRFVVICFIIENCFLFTWKLKLFVSIPSEILMSITLTCCLCRL